MQVDSSCYAIPSPSNVAKWVTNVPQGFKFHFKAFGLFCAQACPANAVPHAVRDELPASLTAAGGQVRLSALPEAAVDGIWRRFHAAIEPAKQARFRRLGYQMLTTSFASRWRLVLSALPAWP
jgi:uncharacterized protein YecE (DUF72 family)